MKKVSRNLKGIKVEAVIFVAAVIFLVVCACSRMPRQPASTVPDSSDSTPNERVDEADDTPSREATIPTEIPKGETPEIETSEGNKSDQKVDPGVIGTLSTTPQDSGKKKPAKIPGIVQDSLDKLNQGVPADSEDLLPVDDQGRILLEFHAAAAVGASEKADLVALGATIETITEDLAWPQGAPLGLGILVAWVPHDQVEAAAAYPWVVAVRPVEENPPDVGTLD